MKTTRRLMLSVLVIMVMLSGRAQAQDIVRIAVARFESAVTDVTEQNAIAITDIFTDTLIHTRSIAVIEQSRVDDIFREQRMGMSGMIDPSTAAMAGKMLGCQYIILGTVTMLRETSKRILDDKSNASRVIAEATLYARVIDTTTREVTFSAYSTGKSEVTIDNYRAGGLSSTQQKAISSAAQLLSSKIREAIVDEAMHVIDMERGAITLNKGSSLGVHVGDVYLVYMDGKELRDLDGTVLGTEVLNIALIEVYDVQDKYSRAGEMKRGIVKNHSNTGNLKLVFVGDKVRYVTMDEARMIIRNGDFIKRRIYPDDIRTTPNDEPSPSPNNLPLDPDPEPKSRLERTSKMPEKVIAGYDLSEKDKKRRIADHKKLVKSNVHDRKTYNGYVALVNSYPKDYLAAYQAGATALAMGMREEARDWFSFALAINPDYKPAKDGLAKTQ